MIINHHFFKIAFSFSLMRRKNENVICIIFKKPREYWGDKEQLKAARDRDLYHFLLSCLTHYRCTLTTIIIIKLQYNDKKC